MKKLLLGSLLILANFASSQIYLQFEETKFGIIAGPDVSRVRNAHNPSSARYAFYFGALAEIPLDYNNQFFIQPQLEYLAAGEKGAGSTVYANNYISVPIFVKGYF